MKRPYVWCAILGSLGLIASLRSMPTLPAIAAAPASTAETVPTAGLHWQGVGSCASTACHDRGSANGCFGSEYATWIRHDRHARAYEILFDERSRRIVANLGDADKSPAHQRLTCLACHADPAPEGQRATNYTPEDGVGCESCHGPAEKWRTVHYLNSWHGLGLAEKEALGMHPTKDLGTRLGQCVDCHVGSDKGDVNHDLIAAGHPRLRFEAGWYLARMPRHWDERSDKLRYPDFEARAWALGQAISAREALVLLAQRATAGEAHRKPWPEFAEYDCAACHHELSPDPRKSAPAGHKPGTLVWGSWYYTMLPELASLVPSAEGQAAEAALRTLRTSLEEPNPNAARVAREAGAAVRVLDDWIAALRRELLDAPKTRHLLESIAHTDPAAVASSSERATQHYLAEAALYQTLTDLDPSYRSPERRGAIDGLRRLLALPGEYDSPREYQPARVREQLNLIDQRLGK